jgi:septum formation protein
VIVADVDESTLPNECAEDYVIRLALAKARKGAQLRTYSKPVLGADTTVVVDGTILGKPAHEGEAIAMLLRLAGRTHQVMTGVALVAGEELTALNISEVTFRAISPAEAIAYWASGEPLDKAGGYAIQGLGAVFTRELRGSYSSVMGLPLFETGQLLARAGINTLGIHI